MYGDVPDKLKYLRKIIDDAYTNIHSQMMNIIRDTEYEDFDNSMMDFYNDVDYMYKLLHRDMRRIYNNYKIKKEAMKNIKDYNEKEEI